VVAITQMFFEFVDFKFFRLSLRGMLDIRLGLMFSESVIAHFHNLKHFSFCWEDLSSPRNFSAIFSFGELNETLISG